MSTFINQFSIYLLITRKRHAALDLNLQVLFRIFNQHFTVF